LFRQSKNSRFDEHKKVEGKRPSFVKILGNHQRQNQPSLWASLWAKALEVVAQKEKKS
jgi:hypothetical protein